MQESLTDFIERVNIDEKWKTLEDAAEFLVELQLELVQRAAKQTDPEERERLLETADDCRTAQLAINEADEAWNELEEEDDNDEDESESIEKKHSATH